MQLIQLQILSVTKLTFQFRFFAKSRATIHLLTLLSNFKRFCKNFESELIRSNSDDEILFKFGQAAISIVRLADETGLSNTPPTTTTSSTSKLDAGTVTNTPSAANDLNNDALNFDLSKILSCTSMARPASLRRAQSQSRCQTVS